MKYDRPPLPDPPFPPRAYECDPPVFTDEDFDSRYPGEWLAAELKRLREIDARRPDHSPRAGSHD